MSVLDVVAIAVLMLGSGMSVMEWRNIRLGIESRRWRAVPCLINKAWVGEHPHGDSGDDDVGYSANVEYEYKIGMRRFRSTRLSFQPTRGLSHEDASALLAGLVMGQRVTGWYDPLEKSRSVLIPDIATGNAFALVLPAVLAVCAAVWLVARFA
ncbi:DUF3592 domain-containing protein [Lysobacter pythonis]|uniref:DUF3592 domain-containing protein n=1 Tax=Solilutibacter pythonis TaxID=2483112 RepID=A0A3M2I4A8_9GAMM|nr:DUF3592 domain-containing protein [Lysobacter pythonis]RMH94850.1 DUF3592 domain-containing protein [Lysobacter pythonis]